MKQLVKWLGSKCNWNLCYRASRDGWSTPHFHRHCDNKGPTVVLVKANGCIFGGYTDQHWDSGGAWKNSTSSFLFSLRNNDNLPPFIANIKQGQEQSAVLGHHGCGSIFGSGPDLIIRNNPQAVQQSFCNFGKTYQLPPGYVFGSKKARDLLAGQYYFLTTEIEVFN